MKINALSNINFGINFKSNSHKLPQLKRDEFVRTTRTMNRDNSSEAFEHWAKETDFISRIDEITENPANIIGSGFEGTTYSIPDCEEWVIKEYKRSTFTNVTTPSPEIIKIKDVTPDLNIGQFVALVRKPYGHSATRNTYVLKKQTGTSYGVSYQSKDIVSKDTISTHISSLKKLSEFPQASFDKLIDDIDYITKQGYKFDCDNPYNYLLDTKNKSINFVDVADKLEGNKTQFGEVLFALLDANFVQTFENSDLVSVDEKQEAYTYSKQICSKFLKAMVRKNHKFTASPYFDKVYNSKAFDGALGVKSADDKIDLMYKLGL
ncbi:MAG: hypothetical protein E7Z90_05160 [Cyanobacteria bacterium SIG29]|nr:hypothetical protein [Cyanobacteria bacterium SIG29]